MWTKEKNVWHFDGRRASVYTRRENGKLVCSTRAGWKSGPKFSSVAAAKAWCETNA